MNVVQNGGLLDGVLELNLEKFQWTLGPVCISSHQNVFEDFFF